MNISKINLQNFTIDTITYPDIDFSTNGIKNSVFDHIIIANDFQIANSDIFCLQLEITQALLDHR